MIAPHISMCMGSLATRQPGCLHTLLNIYQPVRYLHSQDNHNQLLAKPSVYTSTGCCAFSYAAAQTWNAIPLNICNSPSVSSFKRNLKPFCFAAFYFFLNLWFAVFHQWLPMPPDSANWQTLCTLQIVCVVFCIVYLTLVGCDWLVLFCCRNAVLFYNLMNWQQWERT